MEKSILERTATSHRLTARIQLITTGRFLKVKTGIGDPKVIKACQGNRVLMVVLLMPTLLTQTAKTARPTFPLLPLTASTLASTATSHLAIVRIQATITGRSLKAQMARMVKMGCQGNRVPMVKHHTSISHTPIAVTAKRTFRSILPALASISVVIQTLRKLTVLIRLFIVGN